MVWLFLYQNIDLMISGDCFLRVNGEKGRRNKITKKKNLSTIEWVVYREKISYFHDIFLS